MIDYCNKMNSVRTEFSLFVLFHLEMFQIGRINDGFLVSYFQGDEMEHDQLFKELIQTFLGDFIEVFYPDVARQLDFESYRTTP
jgi:hypothetical protein